MANTTPTPATPGAQGGATTVTRFPIERTRPPATAPAPPYRPGDHVMHTPSGKRGIVWEAGPHGATIQFRGKRLATGWENVQGLGPEPAA